MFKTSEYGQLVQLARHAADLGVRASSALWYSRQSWYFVCWSTAMNQPAKLPMCTVLFGTSR